MESPNPWFLPLGRLRSDGWDVVVDPTATPGWEHTGLRVATLGEAERVLPAGPVERMIVPLSGDVGVDWDGADGRGTLSLRGRASVFDGPADIAYVGVGTRVTLRGRGRVAVAEAPASQALPAAVIHREEVPVELRGAGSCTRQVHN